MKLTLLRTGREGAPRGQAKDIQSHL